MIELLRHWSDKDFLEGSDIGYLLDEDDNNDGSKKWLQVTKNCGYIFLLYVIDWEHYPSKTPCTASLTSFRCTVLILF